MLVDAFLAQDLFALALQLHELSVNCHRKLIVYTSKHALSTGALRSVPKSVVLLMHAKYAARVHHFAPPKISPKQSRQHQKQTHTTWHYWKLMRCTLNNPRAGGWVTIESENTLVFCFLLCLNSVRFSLTLVFSTRFLSFSLSIFSKPLLACSSNPSHSRQLNMHCSHVCLSQNSPLHSHTQLVFSLQKHWIVWQFPSIFCENRSRGDSLYWIELDKLHLCITLLRISYSASLA